MKNTFNIVDILMNVLLAEDLGISGTVYRQGERPVDSNLEDVVVNTLPVTNEQIQRSTANVNVHVPNLKMIINGIGNSMPDLVRMEAITDLVVEAIDEKYYSDHWFFVQQQSVFQDEVEAYSNIRIEFYNENIN